MLRTLLPHILLILAILLCSSAPLHADTTWVAGEVYGTWTRDGNPYLVTDTLIGPAGLTLNIQPGVEIWFLDQEIRRTPILVYGRLHAVGQEGDSIFFRSPIADFGGINNNDTPGTEVRLEYCVVDSTHRRIESNYGHTILKHSRIVGSDMSIANYFEIDTIQYCELLTTCGATHMYWDQGVPAYFNTITAPI
jgi:hypothetical protein